MARHRFVASRGFTLVELLVVIAIIGVLMGLLLPAVQSAREAGRRTTCSNNQYQMAFAAIRFNDSNGHLPGWRNRSPNPAHNPPAVATPTNTPSWPVMVLPFVERNDIYKAWADGTLSTLPYVSLFVCPSSPPDSMTSPVLAYAGNAGSAWNGRRADGVMVDTMTAADRVTADDISNADGTGMTALLSEKCISGTAGFTVGVWNTTPTTSGTFTFAHGTALTVVPAFGLTSTAPATKVINAVTIGNGNVTAGQVNLPSSNHPGGVVVAFCDGHTGFLKDSLPRDVYAQLLSWNNSAASAISLTTWGAAARNPLSEGDFQ